MSSMQPYIAYGVKGAAILIISILGVIFYYLVRRGFSILSAKKLLPDSIRLGILVLIRWLTILIVILLSLQQFGVPLSAVWAAFSAIAVMVAIGFIAVWSILSNILCSLLLIMVAPFRMGEKIEVVEPVGGSGLAGKVVDINMLYTTIEMTDDLDGRCLARIPNNVFFQKTIKCYRGEETTTLSEFFSTKREKKNLP